MRLDKFLKVSRIIKRRPIAKLVVDGGKVKLDGKVAKAAAEVKVGQILEIEYYNNLDKDILPIDEKEILTEKDIEQYRYLVGFRLLNKIIYLLSNRKIMYSKFTRTIGYNGDIFEFFRMYKK